MQTTSHFIGIPLKTESFSKVFSKINEYVGKHNLQDAITLQAPMTPHITLYYLEKNLWDIDKIDIKKYISNFDVNQEIHLSELKYFLRNEKKYVLYFDVITNITLKKYRDSLHDRYKRDDVLENSYNFTPHITCLKIKNCEIFEKHRYNIEKILWEQLHVLDMVDINSQNICLYAVDSHFEIEKQIII